MAAYTAPVPRRCVMAVTVELESSELESSELESSELELVLDSLRYTKQAFEQYERYPSDEFKAGRVAEVQRLIDKLRGGRRG
jgi:hypothetical protein